MRLPGTLTIAAVGRLRTSHWRAAQQDYVSRLERYTKLSLIEVSDYLSSNESDAVTIAKEGAALLEAVAGTPWTIALDARGKQTTSEGLASYLHKQVRVYRDIAFLIGGPVGLSDEVLTQCNERLALSALTFPHELARVLLLEQLYRAMTILSGEQYHK